MGARGHEGDAGDVLVKGLDGFDDIDDRGAGSDADEPRVWWEILFDRLSCRGSFRCFDFMGHGRGGAGGMPIGLEAGSGETTGARKLLLMAGLWSARSACSTSTVVSSAMGIIDLKPEIMVIPM